MPALYILNGKLIELSKCKMFLLKLSKLDYCFFFRSHVVAVAPVYAIVLPFRRDVILSMSSRRTTFASSGYKRKPPQKIER